MILNNPNTSLREQKDFILSHILYDLYCCRNHIITLRRHPLHMEFFRVFPDDCECSEFVRTFDLNILQLMQKYNYEYAINMLINELSDI